MSEENKILKIHSEFNPEHEDQLLAVLVLRDFQVDLVKYAEDNWLPSEVGKLKDAIKAISTNE